MIKIKNSVVTLLIFAILIVAFFFNKMLWFVFIIFFGIVVKLIFSKKVSINHDTLLIESFYFKYAVLKKDIYKKEYFVEKNHNLFHLHINDRRFIIEIREKNTLQLLTVIDFLNITPNDEIKNQITKWGNIFSI